MRELEKQGCIDRMALGDNIEAPLDYRANPEGSFLATDQDATSLLKTEVITSASYAISQLSVPVVWTKG